MQHWCRGDYEDCEGLTGLWITHEQAVATMEDQDQIKAFCFLVCHHPNTSIWPRMYCSSRTGGSSPTELCHALSSHHPVHLHLGQQAQYIHLQDSQTTTGVLTTFPKQTSFCIGHLARMEESCLPRQLLVSALPSGKRSVGGQNCRWNDLLVRDLKKVGVGED